MSKYQENLSSNDLFLELEAFSEGRSTHAWKCFGAHPAKDEGGANPIPYVIEYKCNGCGACQAVCLSLSSGSIKSNERAIVVRPIQA